MGAFLPFDGIVRYAKTGWLRRLFSRRRPSAVEIGIDIKDRDCFGVKLCEALGLKADNVKRIELVVDCGAPVSVTVQQWVHEGEADAVVEALKEAVVVE